MAVSIMVGKNFICTGIDVSAFTVNGDEFMNL